MAAIPTAVVYLRLPVELHTRLADASWRARQRPTEFVRALIERALADDTTAPAR